MGVEVMFFARNCSVLLVLYFLVLPQWVSAAKVSLIKDIRPGSDSGYPHSFTTVGDVVFFIARDDLHAYELWKTDGTAEGTTMVKDINPGGRGIFDSQLTNINGVLVFTAIDAIHGMQLWKSDGTEQGTVRLTNINPPIGIGEIGALGKPYIENSIANINNAILFVADDGINGNELWKVDINTGNAQLVRDINPDGDAFGLYEGNRFTALGNHVYFYADGGANGYGLWRTDGQSADLVFALNRDANTWFRHETAVLNDELYFIGDDGINGIELWKTNGTSSTMVTNRAVSASWDNIFYLESANGSLYFVAYDEANGGYYRPWVSTGNGAQVLANVYNVGPNRPFIALNDHVYFTADDAITGNELWRTNGTPAGTHLVKNIATANSSGTGGDDSAQIGDLKVINGVLFFTAVAEPGGESELWRSDGTEAGTLKVLVAVPTYYFSYSWREQVVSINSLLYVTMADDVFGNELWQIDLSIDAPFVANYGVTINEDTPYQQAIASSNAGLNFSIVGDPNRGSVQMLDAVTGWFEYTPYLNQHGTDIFSYKANDGNQDSNIGFISVTINPVNDVPTVREMVLNTEIDAALTGFLHGLDVDYDPLTYSIMQQPMLGTITITDISTGEFVYTPNNGVSGSDTFSYATSDGQSVSNETIVTINIANNEDNSPSGVSSAPSNTGSNDSGSGALFITIILLSLMYVSRYNRFKRTG
ncbi:Ig-like domain-containing protein [Kaarinaea lacus]